LIQRKVLDADRGYQVPDLGTRMTSYRLYFLDAQNHILGVEILDSGSDAEAIEAAGRLANHRSFELWERDRLVARLTRVTSSGSAGHPLAPATRATRADDFSFGFTCRDACLDTRLDAAG
jgi:hypothetical protein